MDSMLDTLDYRGFHVVFYNDDPGQQVYTIWEGSELDFGSFNMNYKEDMQCIIDDRLDTIYRFENDPGICGAKLKWFQNGSYRDIGLYYNLRLLKVYLVKDKDKVNEIALISDANNYLQKYLIINKEETNSQLLK